METGECDRAFFHECLLKAPSGRGHREAGSVKVSLQWHVPSGSVLQQSWPPSCGVEVPHIHGRLGVNARTLTGRQSFNQKISAPLFCKVELKLQKAFQSMLLYKKVFLLGHGAMCKSFVALNLSPKNLSVYPNFDQSTHRHLALPQQILCPLQLIIHTDASKILLDSSSTLPLRKKSPQHIAAVSQDE